MTIQIHHLAEPLVAAMFNGRRVELLGLAAPDDQIDWDHVRSAPAIAFPNVRLAAYGGCGFDGESRIDVALHVRTDLVIAVEIKLGRTRLGPNHVTKLLTPCQKSHSQRRWTGNVMAIFERRFGLGVPDEPLLARLGESTIPVAREWVLIMRREITNGLRQESQPLPKSVRPVSMEDLVEHFGGKIDFNRLARSLVDIDFHDSWFASQPSA
jgi:hypothetical protein